MYTQLAPFSPHRPLLEQSAFLLKELCAGRVHPFPCTCGACVAWAYNKRENKTEGRQFSLRTLFLFFLRRELWISALVESQPKGKPRFNVVKLGRGRRGKKTFSITAHEDENGCWAVSWPEQDDFWKRWKKAAKNARRRDLDYMRRIVSIDELTKYRVKTARRNTLSLIRELSRLAKSRTAKNFLKGYLTGRGFYTYYRRAGDERFQGIVAELEKELLEVDDKGKSILKRQDSRSRPGRNRAHFGMRNIFHVVSLSR